MHMGEQLLLNLFLACGGDMVSKCCCDNGCLYCKEYDDETGKNDYCTYAMCILTKDRKFFTSVVGCVTYIRR